MIGKGYVVDPNERDLEKIGRSVRNAHEFAAPDDASYVVIAASSKLTDERVLTAGNGVSVTDGGAGSTVTIASYYPAGHIFGLTLSNNGSDATNDIDIAAGECASTATTPIRIVLTALTKRLDANWAAGTNQGMRNSAAAITNTTYHIYAVSQAGGANPDIYAHTSATVSTVLTALQAETGGSAYTEARRIGSILRVGGTILAFSQEGDEFLLSVPPQDISAAAPGTAAVTRTLTVPIGIKVVALLSCTSRGDNDGRIRFSSLDQADDPSALNIGGTYTGVVAVLSLGELIRVRTNTSGQIRTRNNVSTATSLINGYTEGWLDTRGRHS